MEYADIDYTQVELEAALEAAGKSVQNVTTGTRTSTTAPLTFTLADHLKQSVSIDAATTSYAGLMTSTQVTLLNRAIYMAIVGTRAATTLSLNLKQNSGSTSVTIPAATTSYAGLMTATDKQKLDGLSSSGPFELKQNLALVGKSGNTSVLTDDATGLADYIAGGGSALVMPSATVEGFKTIAHIMNFYDDGTGTGRVTTANWVTYDSDIDSGAGLYGEFTILGNGTYTANTVGAFSMYNQVKSS